MHFFLKAAALVLAFMLMFSLTACKKTEGTTPDVDAVEPELHDESRGHFINMWVGSDEAVITGGNSFTLSAAPFAEDGIVYIPLADVTAAFGGTVTPEEDGGFTVAYDEIVQETHYEKNMTVWLGDTQATDNLSGTQVDVKYMGCSAVPVLKGNIIFVPDFYFDFYLTQTYAQHDLRTGWITVSNFDDGQMLAGFKLEDDFSLLDTAVQSRFLPMGASKILAEGELYETAYSDGMIELGVRTGSALPEGIQMQIHSITLLTDTYATPRGLRVGDPVDRCYELYGEYPNERGQVIAGTLNITAQNGTITSITYYAGGS